MIFQKVFELININNSFIFYTNGLNVSYKRAFTEEKFLREGFYKFLKIYPVNLNTDFILEFLDLKTDEHIYVKATELLKVILKLNVQEIEIEDI